MNKQLAKALDRRTWPRKVIDELKTAWLQILVFFGFRVWAKVQWNRPKFSRCAFHGLMMKRGRKTAKGAFYWCPKCQCEYLLDCAANKLVSA